MQVGRGGGLRGANYHHKTGVKKKFCYYGRMDIFEAFVLGALQGITEFLPISSSGHLVLGESFFNLEVHNLKSFDVVVHLGTLLAILIYFWRDIWMLIKGFFALVFEGYKKGNVAQQLIFYIIIGTLPAVFAGLYLEDYIDKIFRNVNYVAGAMIVLGFVFIGAEFFHKKRFAAGLEEKIKHNVPGLNWHKAILIGVAQALALVPGVSRSGSTIVAGLFQGIERSSAARFSFLLGIPAISGAGLLTALKVSSEGGFAVDFWPLIIGFLSSFIFGIISVSFLMKFLKKNSLMVFAVYLIVFGSMVFFF